MLIYMPHILSLSNEQKHVGASKGIDLEIYASFNAAAWTWVLLHDLILLNLTASATESIWYGKTKTKYITNFKNDLMEPKDSLAIAINSLVCQSISFKIRVKSL